MTQLPTLTLYQGQIPDKSTMDRITFANSVHDYLNYFAINFTPETNDFVTKLNTLSTEIQGAADTAASAAQTAQDARDAAMAVANFKGVWDNSTAYSAGETVFYVDNLYLAMQDSTGVDPTSDPAIWKPLSNIVYKYVNTDYMAKEKEFLLIDTANNTITVTLPPNPAQFAVVGFLDATSSYETNNLTIVRGDATHKIIGLAEDMVVDKNNLSFELIFYNGDWRLK